MSPAPYAGTPPTVDHTKPTAPGTPVVTNANANQTATVTVTASTDNVAVAGYAAFLDGSPAEAARSATTAIQLSGVPAGAHSVVVRAFDAAGNYSDPSAEAVFDMPDLPRSNETAVTVASSIANLPAPADLGFRSARAGPQTIQGCVNFLRHNLNNGLVVENLLDKEFVSQISKTQTGATVTADDDNQSIAIVCQSGGRGFITIFSTAKTFVAGHIYCLSVRISNLVKPTSTNSPFIARTGVAPALDLGVESLAMTELSVDGTYAIIFQPTTSQAISWRIGMGTNDVTTGDSSCVIDEISVVDLTESSIAIPPPAPDPKQAISISADYSGSLTSQTHGLLTLTTNVQSLPRDRFSLAVFGDSWVNDTIDYPDRLRLLSNPRVAVWVQRETVAGSTVAGTRPSSYLSTFNARIQRLIDKNHLTAFVIIQSSLNTINQTGLSAQYAAIAADTAEIEAAAMFAISNGIIPILTLIQPCKLGIATWISDNKYFSAQKHDQIIQNIAARIGCIVFDFKRSVGDSADRYSLSATYDSGDGLHPNQAGADVIAIDLQNLIANSVG